MEHHSSKLEVNVARRADREPLISVYLGPSKQVCQAPVARFASEEDVVAIMILVGQAFAKGEKETTDLYSFRDQLAWERFGISLKSKRACKRPATRAIDMAANARSSNDTVSQKGDASSKDVETETARQPGANKQDAATTADASSSNIGACPASDDDDDDKGGYDEKSGESEAASTPGLPSEKLQRWMESSVPMGAFDNPSYLFGDEPSIE